MARSAHRTEGRSTIGVWVLLLVLVAAACSSSDEPSSGSVTSSEAPPESAVPETSGPESSAPTPEQPGEAVVTAPGEDVIRLGPVETATALSDPATAETGVWSVLANLGIGVYTGGG
jgi:hypothetical protein